MNHIHTVGDLSKILRDSSLEDCLKMCGVVNNEDKESCSCGNPEVIVFARSDVVIRNPSCQSYKARSGSRASSNFRYANDVDGENKRQGPDQTMREDSFHGIWDRCHNSWNSVRVATVAVALSRNDFFRRGKAAEAKIANEHSTEE